MGTKIPPPPTPPTVPNAEPRNPMTVATTTRQLNARSWRKPTGEVRKPMSATKTGCQSARGRGEAKERAAYGPDARGAGGQA
jgi:hypothetical protein